MPYLYAQCALGSLVATQCDLMVFGRHLPLHLTFAVLLGGGVVLWTHPLQRFRAMGTLSIAFAIASCFATGSKLGLLAMVTAVGFLTEIRLPVSSGLIKRVTWSLSLGPLPFWAGYLASGHRLAASAWLLGGGFLATTVAAYPLLNPAWDRKRKAETAAINSWATAALLLGLAAIFAWLWVYGAGAWGIALAAPGALAFLWLATDSRAQRPRVLHRRRRLSAVAWLGLTFAVAVACYV